MFDYVLITLAVCCFASQFAFTKVFEKSTKQTIATSFVMLLLSNLSGVLILLCVGAFKISFSPFSLFWATAQALIMIPYYVIGIKVLSLGALAIYSMFMMLGGMLVPFFFGIIWLREDISVCKLIGSVLLTLFIILQALGQTPSGESANNRTKKTKRLFIILCVAIFFINGFTGVIAKSHQMGADAVDEISFTVISCALTASVSAAVLAFMLAAGRKKLFNEQIRPALRIKPILAIVAIAASAYVGSLFHLKAANNVPASVQFPLVSGGVIVLSALVSAFVFKEKLTKKEWLCIVGAFLSTFLFAF